MAIETTKPSAVSATSIICVAGALFAGHVLMMRDVEHAVSPNLPDQPAASLTAVRRPAVDEQAGRLLERRPVSEEIAFGLSQPTVPAAMRGRSQQPKDTAAELAALAQAGSKQILGSSPVSDRQLFALLAVGAAIALAAMYIDFRDFVEEADEKPHNQRDCSSAALVAVLVLGAAAILWTAACMLEVGSMQIPDLPNLMSSLPLSRDAALLLALAAWAIGGLACARCDVREFVEADEEQSSHHQRDCHKGAALLAAVVVSFAVAAALAAAGMLEVGALRIPELPRLVSFLPLSSDAMLVLGLGVWAAAGLACASSDVREFVEEAAKAAA